MGEKGNITSEELVGVVAGAGSTVAGTGTEVTAIVYDAADAMKDKIIDKGADAGIAGATEKWQQHRADTSSDDPPVPS